MYILNKILKHHMRILFHVPKKLAESVKTKIYCSASILKIILLRHQHFRIVKYRGVKAFNHKYKLFKMLDFKNTNVEANVCLITLVSGHKRKYKQYEILNYFTFECNYFAI